MDTGKRVNKYMSETGYCSRREADNLVAEGVVTIDGKKAKVGMKVYPSMQVAVKGKILGKKPEKIYIALNKPVGITSTTDRKDKTNIIDFIGHEARIFPIGRLDKFSEGLILLTNDGDSVNKILRAGNQHEKEYIVQVNKKVTDVFIKKMSQGVKILDTKTNPCKVVKLKKHLFKIILTQGLNRQIRRMCTALGYEVVRLKRTRIMTIHLGHLPEGQWRYFTKQETKELEKLLSYSSNV